jgi:hypothetical protein
VPAGLLSGTNLVGASPVRTASGARLVRPLRVSQNPLIETFTDPFASLTNWTTVAGTPSIVSGQLRLSSNGTQGDQVQSVGQNWNLQGSQAVIEVATLASGDYREAYFGVTAPGGNPFQTADLGFFMTGDGSAVNIHVNGADSGQTFTFSSTSSHWLRLRETADQVYFETAAAQSGPWTQVGLVSTPSWVTACQVMLAVFFANTAATPVVAFDNLNVSASNPVDAGTLDMSAASDWTGAGGQIFLAGTLDHAGTADWTGAGTQIVLGGTLDHAGSSDWTGAGTSLFSAALDLSASSDWTGAGGLLQDAGTLDLSAISDLAGAGGLLLLSGALDLAATSDLTGAGAVLVASGVLDHAGASDWAGAGVLAASSGTLALSGLSDFAGAGGVAVPRRVRSTWPPCQISSATARSLGQHARCGLRDHRRMAAL